MVELETADLREVIALGVETQVFEIMPGHIHGRGLARSHPLVDVHHRFCRGGNLVDEQGVPEGRADVVIVDVENVELADPPLPEFFDLGLGEFLVALDHDLARALVDHIVGDDLTDHGFRQHRDVLEASFQEPGDRGLAGELLSLLEEDLAAGLIDDIDLIGLTFEQVRDNALTQGTVILEDDVLREIEEVEQLFLGITERLEKNGCRELAPAIDADMDDVFVVELEIDPRTAIRNNPGVVELLATAVRLALVVIEEDARGAVQLADDDSFGTVDDEGPGLGHDRDLTEVDLLFLDVADGDGADVRIFIPDHQTDRHLHGRGEGHAALPTLVDVVFGVGQMKGNEFKGRGFVKVLDRENTLENGLQTGFFSLIRRNLPLKKFFVRMLLNFN